MKVFGQVDFYDCAWPPKRPEGIKAISPLKLTCLPFQLPPRWWPICLWIYGLQCLCQVQRHSTQTPKSKPVPTDGAREAVLCHTLSHHYRPERHSDQQEATWRQVSHMQRKWPDQPSEPGGWGWGWGRGHFFSHPGNDCPEAERPCFEGGRRKLYDLLLFCSFHHHVNCFSKLLSLFRSV